MASSAAGPPIQHDGWDLTVRKDNDMQSLRLTSTIMSALVLSVSSACGVVVDGPGNSGPQTAADTRGPEFGACSEPWSGDGPDALQFLADVSGWIPIIDSDAVVEATREHSGERWTFPAVIRRPDKVLETVQIHASVWPGIDWGLANKAKVWLAMADASSGADQVAYVVVVASDGSVFFPGECAETVFRQRMIHVFGSEYSDLAGEIPGKTRSEIDTLLQASSATPTQEASPAVVVLNPESAPRALLDSLQSVIFHFRLKTPLGRDYTICTRVSAGWNGDCFPADETAATGLVMDGYVGADRRVEVWLLDAGADMTSPIRPIGDVFVPVDLAKLQDVALDLAVSIDGASPGTTPRAGDRVTLLDTATADALTSKDWPGLNNGGSTPEPLTPGNE